MCYVSFKFCGEKCSEETCVFVLYVSFDCVFADVVVEICKRFDMCAGVKSCYWCSDSCALGCSESTVFS